jgi:outer membrane protein assembly factor BamE
LSFTSKSIACLSLLVPMVLSGCQRMPTLPGLTPYKVDIQQGNYVTQDMVDRLKPGMSKSQVRFALGTPLVVDPFHNDRWDYIYVLQKRGRVIEQRRIVAIFADDKLLRIDGDVMPAPANAAPASAPGPAPAAAVTPSASASPLTTAKEAAAPTPLPAEPARLRAPADKPLAPQ